MRILTFLNDGTELKVEGDGVNYYIFTGNCEHQGCQDAICTYIDKYAAIHRDDVSLPSVHTLADDDVYVCIPVEIYDKVDFEMVGEVQLLLEGNGARRPGYQIRGRKLSPEQAFDVLANSDEVFRTYINDTTYTSLFRGQQPPADVDQVQSAMVKDRILSTPYRHIGNKFLQKENFPWYSGFVTPAGDVGCNWWAYKYPEYFEVFVDVWVFAARFPYLEFVVAVTDWNERSPEWSDAEDESDEPLFWDNSKELQRDLKYCLYVHDGAVEILSDLNKYFEFDALYSDKRVFEVEDYYKQEKRNVMSWDFAYRMITVHGLQNSSDFVHYVRKCYEAQHKFPEEVSTGGQAS